MSDFQSWLEGTFGRKQLEKFQGEKAKEVATTREGLAGEIAKLESERDKQLADLTPKVNAAKKRMDDAIKEVGAAGNSYGMLRRRRSSLVESTERKVAKLRQRLTESADPRIDALLAEIENARREILSFQPSEQVDRSGEDDGLFFKSTGRKVFSQLPTVEKRLGIVAELRREAESLRWRVVGDLDAAIGTVRARIPAGPLEMALVFPRKESV